MRRANLLPLLLLAACSHNAVESKSNAPASTISVQTAAVIAGESAATYDVTGTVRARSTAAIASRTPAYVQSVAVQQGDRVSQGQVLVTLDARDLEANVRRAEAGYTEASSAIAEVDSGIAAAKANLDLAAVTFNRIQDLAAKNSVSKQELDEAAAKLKSAQANHDMARAKRSQVQARIEQAEQDRRSASVARSYATLTAPFAGIVSAKTVEPGNMALPGVTLLSIERGGQFRLEAAVDESKLPGVHMGDHADVAVPATGCDGTSRVTEIVPAVEAGSRSYIVKLDLPPPDSHGRPRPCPGLRSGMFGRAAFASGQRTMLTAPAAAVIERGQVQTVFVVEDGYARTRLVTVGRRTPSGVEILSGLSSGERVVAPVPAALTDGARVEVHQ